MEGHMGMLLPTNPGDADLEGWKWFCPFRHCFWRCRGWEAWYRHTSPRSAKEITGLCIEKWKYLQLLRRVSGEELWKWSFAVTQGGTRRMPEYVCECMYVHRNGWTHVALRRKKVQAWGHPRAKHWKFLHSVKLRKFSFLKINVRRKSQMSSEKPLSMKLLEFSPSLI